MDGGTDGRRRRRPTKDRASEQSMQMYYADSNPVSASPAMSSDDPHSDSRQSRDSTAPRHGEAHYELSLPFNF